jgi:hypothetical protein
MDWLNWSVFAKYLAFSKCSVRVVTNSPQRDCAWMSIRNAPSGAILKNNDLWGLVAQQLADGGNGPQITWIPSSGSAHIDSELQASSGSHKEGELHCSSQGEEVLTLFPMVLPNPKHALESPGGLLKQTQCPWVWDPANTHTRMTGGISRLLCSLSPSFLFVFSHLLTYLLWNL